MAGLAKGSPHERRVDIILQAVDRGRRLTRQLLSFARRQAIAPVTVHLSSSADSLFEVIRASLRGDIRCVLDLPAGLWPICVDQSEFEIAMINLAVNARDAMPAGGSFIVRARNEMLSGREVVVISVADTGAGIPADLLPRIFEPFFTTKPVGQGTGLGLSQVFGFVQQAGGEVHVESEPGRGTQFSMCFPRAVETAAAERTPASPQAAPRRRVLLAEDNSEVAEITREQLESFGHVVTWRPNAASALREIESGAYDALVSDVIMPGGVSGVELADQVSKLRPQIRILLVTGYSDELCARGSRYPVLRKPFTSHELQDALERLFADGAAPVSADAIPGA
jgi:CheY-like chemotaxis protein